MSLPSAPPAQEQQTRLQALVNAVPGINKFLNAITLRYSPSRLSNEDLLPSAAVRQTWHAIRFLAFWWSVSWSVSTWSIGSSLIAAGATTRDALLIVFFANLLSAAVMVLNGAASTKYHVGYPVLSRSTFGIHGHYFVVILRLIWTVISAGNQMYFLGQFTLICILSIKPRKDGVPNNIPADQSITTDLMLSILCASVLTIAFLYCTGSRIQVVCYMKSFWVPFIGAWTVWRAQHINGGTGVAALDAQTQATRPSTAVFAWAIVSQFNAIMGSNSALMLTVPDIARYARTRNAQIWAQCIAFPFGQMLCASFGIITTAAILQKSGEAYWNPYDLLNNLLADAEGAWRRLAVIFGASCFAISTLGTLMACSVIPFAADVTSLLPKYVNIARGRYLCVVIAFAIAPLCVAAPAGVLTFLKGYSIFQGPVVAIMLVDYFILRRGYLAVGDLFSRTARGIYHYTYGVNPRAFAALVLGLILPLPGFIRSFDSSSSSGVAAHLYSLG